MSSIKKSVSKLFLATVGMFLFGFALVPIYDVFCEITGLNGKSLDLLSPNTKISETVKLKSLSPLPTTMACHGFLIQTDLK